MIVPNAAVFNGVSQEEYDVFLGVALPIVMGGACEKCLSIGHMIKWGVYVKVLFCIVPDDPECRKAIRIQRIFCKNCGHTFSVLPDSIIPRLRFTLVYLYMIIRDYISQQNQIESKTDLISQRTIRRYVRRFHEWNQEYQINILDISYRKLRDFCIESQVSFLCKPPPTQTASVFPS